MLSCSNDSYVYTLNEFEPSYDAGQEGGGTHRILYQGGVEDFPAPDGFDAVSWKMAASNGTVYWTRRTTEYTINIGGISRVRVAIHALDVSAQLATDQNGTADTADPASVREFFSFQSRVERLQGIAVSSSTGAVFVHDWDRILRWDPRRHDEGTAGDDDLDVLLSASDTTSPERCDSPVQSCYLHGIAVEDEGQYGLGWIWYVHHRDKGSGESAIRRMRTDGSHDELVWDSVRYEFRDMG